MLTLPCYRASNTKMVKFDHTGFYVKEIAGRAAVKIVLLSNAF